MSIANTVVVLVMSFLLMSCSGGGAETSSVHPKIGKIYTDILHSHPSFYTKWGVTPVRNIRFSVSADVSDPQGIDNLRDVVIHQVQDDWYWSLLGGERRRELADCFVVSIGVFECNFYSSGRLDSILLQEWELLVEDVDGNIASKPFQFLLPGGDEVDQEQFVYSSQYAGSTINGVEAIESMTIADNNMVFTSSPGTQSFHIEFDPTDLRVRRYEFAFYEDSANRDYIGSAQANSPTVLSHPIIPGLGIVIDLPWSEIYFDDGFDASDVGGLHVTLFDEPIEWNPPSGSGSWFNYIGFSEYLEL